MPPLSAFDLDLRKGQLREALVRSLLATDGLTVEVKADFLAHATGNVAVEFLCRGKPSGLSVTRADWWAFVIHADSVVVFIRTESLKAIARCAYRAGRVVRAGEAGEDGRPVSWAVLVPVSELVRFSKSRTE